VIKDYLSNRKEFFSKLEVAVEKQGPVKTADSEGGVVPAVWADLADGEETLNCTLPAMPPHGKTGFWPKVPEVPEVFTAAAAGAAMVVMAATVTPTAGTDIAGRMVPLPSAWRKKAIPGKSP